MLLCGSFSGDKSAQVLNFRFRRSPNASFSRKKPHGTSNEIENNSLNKFVYRKNRKPGSERVDTLFETWAFQ